MGNGIVKVCAKCGQPTKKQFRTVCKNCGHDRWAPPTEGEQLALAFARTRSKVGTSHVAPSEQFSDPVVAYSKSSHEDPASEEEYDESIEIASTTRNFMEIARTDSASANIVRQTPQLDLAQLNISSAFLTANTEEAIKSPRPFGRSDASRSDTSDNSECSRVRIGPRRGNATRNLREMQMILRQESPGRSGTMPSESRNNRHRHSEHSESKTQSLRDEREGGTTLAHLGK